MWKLYALSMFARILKNPSKAHFTVLDRQSPVAGLQLIRDFALTNDLLCVWGENFCNLCWCSVSQRPESDGSTASVSDPGQSDWMTPGSGTRCWRTAAVHLACSREMLHDSYLATDGRIDRLWLFGPGALYVSAEWPVSGWIQISQAFVSHVAMSRPEAPATGPVFILWGATDDKQQSEAKCSEMKPNSSLQSQQRLVFLTAAGFLLLHVQPSILIMF